MTRKILSIDGGGIKGVLPAAFLAEIERATGKSVREHFDLVAGTSSGGILALGLGLGLPAARILELFEARGPAIFKTDPKGLPWSLLPRAIHAKVKRLVNTKYDSKELHQALVEVFGQRLLGESAVRLLIPAFESQRRTVHLFKTSHDERLQIDYRVSAVSIAMATAAAPTYFPAWRIDAGGTLIDGGVWANNPVGAAAVEAVGLLKWEGASLRVLSLGCSETVFKVAKGGIASHASTVVDLFMAGQSQASHGTAKLLTGHTDDAPRVFRVNPAVARGAFALDGVNDIAELKGLGADLARELLPVMERVFLDQKVEPFVPSHAL